MKYHRRQNTVRRSFDTLESRCMLSVWGVPWPEPEQLTISFVPDGTSVQGNPSELRSMMDQLGPTAAWQKSVLAAFQTWSNHAQINFSLSSDDGIALGSTTSGQGSPKSGDIRIAAADLSHTELAVAAPFDLFSSWSGEIVLNSRQSFSLPGGTGTDLFTVLLQEAGHALSLPPSGDPQSAMFGTYSNPRWTLSSSDIDAIQRLYGPRRPDRFDAAGDNGTSATATSVEFVTDVDQFRGGDPQAGDKPFVVTADLHSKSDVDTYRVSVPPGLNDFHVVLRTQGVSLLNAKVTVIDSRGRTLLSQQRTDPLADDLQLFVPNVTGGRNYFVRVQAADGSEFPIGGYQLAIGKEAQEAVFPNETNYLRDDRGDDDEGVDSIVALEPQSQTVSTAWDFNYRASISFSGDRDTYEISVPPGTTSSTSLVVGLWSMDPEKLQAQVRIYADALRTLRVPTEIIRNDNGVFAVQVRNVTAGERYFLEVVASDPNGSFKEGNYQLAADVRPVPLILPEIGSGTFQGAETQKVYQLINSRSQVQHLALHLGEAAIGATPVAGRVTIYDSNRQVVHSFTTGGAETGTGSVLLPAGEYFVRVVAASQDGSPLPPTTFRLAGTVLSDPIGPTPVNPLIYPSGSHNGSYYSYYYPYYYPYYVYYSWYSWNSRVSWMSPVDPYANPWWRY